MQEAAVLGFGVQYHQYMGDTQLYFSFISESAEPVDHCLQAVMGWMTTNKLKLNPCKTGGLLVDDKIGEGIWSLFWMVLHFL